MFWVFCVLSMLGFALNYVFIANLVRSLPTFQAIAYRGFGLAVTMLPFVLLFSPADFSATLVYLPQLFLGSLFTTLSLFLFFESMKKISLGISNAIRQSFIVISIALFGLWLLGDQLSVWHWGLIGVILMGNILFRLTKTSFHLKHYADIEGLLLALMSGVMGGLGMFCIGKISQVFDPYIAGYAWEVGIAVLALLFSFLKKEHKTANFSFEKYWKMLWASSPTLLSTFGFALAATLGPMGIIGAIQAGGVVVVAVLSYFLHREQLLLQQWIGIGIITLGIIGFRFI